MNLVGIAMAAATVGVLTAVVVSAAPRWTADAHDRAAVAELQLVLRDAQQRAVGEGHPVCVEREISGRWSIRATECAAGSDGVTFFADGSATERTILLGADTVTVDGQTGRIRAP